MNLSLKSAILGDMKTITLTNMARFLGVSVPFLSEVAHGKKRFSSRRARNISDMTGIPLEHLLFADGDKIIHSLRVAYTLQRQTSEGKA